MVTPGSVQDNQKTLVKKLIKLGDIPHSPRGIFTLNQQPEPELYASDVKSQDAPYIYIDTVFKKKQVLFLFLSPTPFLFPYPNKI